MLLLLPIAFGVTTAVIANSKGRDKLGWLLAGCLFGPFALIAVACMPVLVVEHVAFADRFAPPAVMLKRIGIVIGGLAALFLVAGLMSVVS